MYPICFLALFLAICEHGLANIRYSLDIILEQIKINSRTSVRISSRKAAAKLVRGFLFVLIPILSADIWEPKFGSWLKLAPLCSEARLTGGREKRRNGKNRGGLNSYFCRDDKRGFTVRMMSRKKGGIRKYQFYD